MLNHPTLEKLKALKLNGMAKGLAEQLSSSGYDGLSFEERLGLLVDLETTQKDNRRLKTRLTQARLRISACMEDIDYTSRRGLEKSLMQALHTGRWIQEGHNILITGPTGVGKSYLACAIGHRACLLGYKVRYYRATRLFEEMKLTRGDGRYPKLMNQIAKSQLLIVDDWGLCQLGETERKDFLEILEERHPSRSTLIAGQLPIEHWHDIIGNPTYADAILDRLVHNAYKINLAGDSMRKRKTADLPSSSVPAKQKPETKGGSHG